MISFISIVEEAVRTKSQRTQKKKKKKPKKKKKKKKKKPTDYKRGSSNPQEPKS